MLAAGLLSTEGNFEKADVISIATADGKVFAQGISSFSSQELEMIQGKANDEISNIFPGKTRLEVVHRDHLAPIFSKGFD